jgi:hypothetical protein
MPLDICQGAIMENTNTDWRHWRQFFAKRANRKLPELEAPERYSAIPPSVAKSLAVFQLGESGGGSIISQARKSSNKTIDSDYADALDYFVKEEHRHAELLAICVRNLGGELIRRNWTASLFVSSRRLIGLRLKILVLLAAEVVGICYYHLLATRLPRTRLQALLAQIVEDERSHLYFHCSFLRAQACTPWRRAVFVSSWRITMLAAAVVVMIDHRKALRDLDLSVGTVWRRWMSYSHLAERLVVDQEDIKQAECLMFDEAHASTEG